MKKKYSLPLFLGLACLLFILAWLSATLSSNSLNGIAQKASQRLNDKAETSREALRVLLSKDPAENQQDLVNYYSDESIGLYLLQNDSLIFWNNSELPIAIAGIDFTGEQGLSKTNHGEFIYFKQKQQSKVAIACLRLKPLYDLENNYLKNDFSEWTSIPSGIKLSTDSLSQNQVKLSDTVFFAIKSNESLFYDRQLSDLAYLFFVLGFIALLISVLVYLSNGGEIKKAMLAGIGIIGLRTLMIYWHAPDFIYHSTLYDLKLFGNAQSFMNGYLGDIWLNAFFFLFLSFLLRTSSNKTKFTSTKGILLVTCVLLFINLFQFNQIAASLVTNSTLNFDFINIFSLKLPVFIALGALGVYFICFFMTVINTISLVTKYQKTAPLIYALLYLGISVLYNWINPQTGFFNLLWPATYALVLFVLSVYLKIKTPFLFGIQLLFMSLVISMNFNYHIHKNQQQDLEILSLKLSEKQDAILENEFDGIPQRIKSDQNFANLIEFLSAVPSAQKEIELMLKQKYFSGYFDRFNIDFSLFNKSCEPLLAVKQAVLANQGYFEDQIEYHSNPTSVDGLFYVNNNKKGSRYIGKIELNDKNLFVLIEPKQFEELGSFPDLLLDQSQQKPEKLKQFSHAVYREQQITNRYGEFNYPLFLQDSLVLQSANSNFVHHYYMPDSDTHVIISEQKKDWKYFFTFNSYLLLFFSFMAYLAYLFYSAVFTTQFYTPTLTRRIQTIIITLLFLAMSAVGITSVVLVSRQFESENKKELDEKTQIIISELNSQFKSEQIFDETQKELINLKLKEYARLFNTPISLFSKEGKLFNTSEDKFYELGLAAPLMNREVFAILSQNRSSSESAREQAGQLTYLSHYAPLFDSEKHLIGFVNLPYFAKQSDLLNELSGIISALINVYVILFVISILAGLILSGFITQPLRFIKQQLSHITLGKRNDKIVWQSDDEVGKLVFEYNQMLIKLEKSAELLAQSERESAWREMAKQVAHEIKNPLTPMKLNLQYLQHLIKNDSPDFKEKFEKASAGIIEQIDSLANIASAFSNFAKLPGTRLQSINLVEISEAAQLVFLNQKRLQFINHMSAPEIWVKGDRDQCLRVFNNIFKNALQATENCEVPRIEVSAEILANKVIVSIKDNGCGIPEELQAKIFTPNFTTKSSGSGLGLAMVKSSMIGFEGDVRFDSEMDKGTTFYLEFSRADDQPNL